ncbi:hypothetical protein FHS43_003766 [Streptosporangium becharense]|uniref:Uncharacterized protein n=1 Tax=Streptosporangium becharense TaxID=1816182 RepID=A0A7W9IH96_9ACTN|nr:hypothetical protein [Streptosporangium becharense]MBB2912483.1 hypothetical protein [Streptosporangium becharense]MBB5820687.1 hypothetical protein [Streptosporangium becharense]
MSEFETELRMRVDEVDSQLRLLRQAEDDHAVEVLSGRLENLLRIAERHGIDLGRAVEAPAAGTA